MDIMDSRLKEIIRDIKDFPKPGIVFKDITTLLKDPDALSETADMLFEYTRGHRIDKVVGIDSRGFIFGGLLANKLHKGFVPVRKPGKLPADTIQAAYQLEYGRNILEIHKDAIQPGDRVLIHDDLLATGGTAKATCALIEQLGGKVEMITFIIELAFLQGRNVLSSYDVHSIVQYDPE